MKTTIPMSVRFSPENAKKLAAFMAEAKKVGIGFKDIVDFSVAELFRALESGAKIQLGSDGRPVLQPPSADPVAAVSAELRNRASSSGKSSVATKQSAA